LFNGSGTLISYRHYNVKENEKIKVYSIQNYLNGKKEGAGVSYDCEGKMEEKRLYRNDSLITSKEMNDDYDITTKKKYNFFTCSDEDDITSVEVMPEYPGGLEWLLKYLGNISYPPVARENDIEGTVYIRFVIDRNGQILNPEVIRGADKILNDAALLHIIRMPGWSMGIQRAMPIKVNYVVPIRFKLF
jgi:TonB family protein